MSATVHLLCGKTGSGKTTFARALEQERKALLLSADEWMILLFGRDMERELFDARLRVCKELIYGVSERLTRLGVDVVLDFGFWARAERNAARDRISASGAAHVLYFFDAADDVLRKRLRARNSRLPANAYEITDEMFEEFGGMFEPPAADETCVRIVVE